MVFTAAFGRLPAGLRDKPMTQSETAGDRRAYSAGVAVAAATSLLIVWTTIVRDDGSGLGSFGVILAAMVGAFAAEFQPAGLARAMVGTAAMQGLIGVGIATAPVTRMQTGLSLRVLVISGVLAALWLAAAALFRAAVRR